MPRQLYNNRPAFRPLPSELTAAMLSAVRCFLVETRPHDDYKDRVDREMIVDELLAARREIPAASLDEIETYIQAVLGARTAGAAREVVKPPALQHPAKSKPLDDSQRTIRAAIARLLYLRALDADTAVMSPAALSRVKSQTWQKPIQFDLGIVLIVACPGCKGAAELTLCNLHESTAYRFNCRACRHQYRGDRDQSKIAANCTCSLCVDSKNKLVDKILRLLSAASDSMQYRYDEWRNMLYADVDEWPSDLEMERDYRLHRDNLGKDVRAILSLRPSDAADFEDCIERYLQTHKGKPRSILETALDRRVLYARQRPDIPSVSTAIDLIAEAGKETSCIVTGKRLWGCGGIGTDNASTILGDFLARKIQVSDLVVDSGGIMVRQQMLTKHGTALVSLRLLASEEEREGLLDGEIQYNWATERILNPYFIGIAKPPEFQHEQRSGNARPLFNSRTEGQAYLRIVGENPGCIVVPNRLLKRIVDFGRLSPMLEKREFGYAKDAEIDFAVYDDDGHLLFVEELQRGDHHNQPEWIWKDAVKRKVLHLAGIPLRESF